MSSGLVLKDFTCRSRRPCGEPDDEIGGLEVAKKVRQYCEACKQVTTQVKESADEAWKCSCCESAKFRSKSATQHIQSKNAGKPRFNTTF
jgi:ribosomal protein L37AE/L43A